MYRQCPFCAIPPIFFLQFQWQFPNNRQENHKQTITYREVCCCVESRWRREVGLLTEWEVGRASCVNEPSRKLARAIPDTRDIYVYPHVVVCDRAQIQMCAMHLVIKR